MAEKTQKIDLTGMALEDLCRSLADLGLKPYRGNQVFQWIHQCGEVCFDRMTNLSKTDRTLLSERTRIQLPFVADSKLAEDGTEKYLFRLEDGHSVEGVLIPEDRRMTLCVSTQVGCAMGCTFCLTGKQRLIRNLTAAEIIGQVLVAQSRRSPDRPLTHIVFMGMGEPLANYANCMQAIRILLDPLGPDFSKRRLTLSTCGLTPKIQRLARENLGINLAVSLNASDRLTRDRIMPVNRQHPMEDLLETLRGYPIPGRSRITFEYVLIRSVNDSLQDARRLAQILKGIRCKINLIPLNPIPGNDFKPPSRQQVEAFQKVLLDAHYTAMIRESRGHEISAACGQLREQMAGPTKTPPD